tara:strand:+ start:1861 stop:3243 length:1383 start_codon:yes stop_codon:yes gene_type:complete
MKKLIKVLFCLCFIKNTSSQETIFKSQLISVKHDLVKKNSIIYEPIFYTGISLNKNFDKSDLYLVGIQLQSNINHNLLIGAQFDHLAGDYNNEIIKYRDSLGFVPGFGRKNKRIQFYSQYSSNKFITSEVGFGRHFIGEGYHSLLLSDFGESYPYLKLITEFGGVQYFNLYTTFINPNMTDVGRKKHSTIHYLNYDLTKNINIGIFESILWQSKGEEEYRGFELAYLNPVIFYRPVEFSKQSRKGNALMGATFNMKYKKLIFYSQLLLDDLNISRQKDADESYTSGFFQNKFGYQLGVKGKVNSFDYLFEFNQVQPYTYAHKIVLQNYSHMNQALAHPYGANFREFVSVFKFNKNNWIYKLTGKYVKIGLDSIDTHYGQNIFMSDFNASTGGEYSYGNYNGQGVQTQVLSIETEIAYKLDWFTVFGNMYFRLQNSNLFEENIVLCTVGIRTFFFSKYKYY